VLKKAEAGAGVSRGVNRVPPAPPDELAAALALLPPDKRVTVERHLRPPQRRRGGEPPGRAERRRQRDAALRVLATGIGLEAKADAVVARIRQIERDVRRGRAVSERESRAVKQLRDCGLQLPGRKQLSNILKNSQ
jgi:hypothetical protein